jgi:hypothetical protein
VGSGVVLRIYVEIANLVPVAVELRRTVLSLTIDEVLAALCVVVNGEIGLGEMALPREPSHKLPIKVCPVLDSDLKRSVKECSRVNGIIELHASQIGDSARLLIHGLPLSWVWGLTLELSGGEAVRLERFVSPALEVEEIHGRERHNNRYCLKRQDWQ